METTEASILTEDPNGQKLKEEEVVPERHEPMWRQKVQSCACKEFPCGPGPQGPSSFLTPVVLMIMYFFYL